MGVPDFCEHREYEDRCELCKRDREIKKLQADLQDAKTEIERRRLSAMFGTSCEVLGAAMAQSIKEMRDQLIHDAANLRDYAQCTEPAGVARVMVEVAEHLEELCGTQAAKQEALR